MFENSEKVFFIEMKDNYSPNDTHIECRFYCRSQSEHIFVQFLRVFDQKVIEMKNVSKESKELEKDFGLKSLKFLLNRELIDTNDVTDCVNTFRFQSFDVINNAVVDQSHAFTISANDDVMQGIDQSEDDFVVVRSREALLEERIEKLLLSNNILELSKRQTMMELSERERALTEMSSGRDQSIRESDVIRGELESRVNALSEELLAMRESNDVITKHNDVTVEELKRVKDECDVMKALNARLESEREREREERALLGNENKVLEKSLEKSLNDSKGLEKELTQMRAEMVDLEKYRVLKKLGEKEAEELGQKRCDRERELERELSEMRARLLLAKHEFTALLRKNMKNENRIEKMRNKWESEKSCEQKTETEVKQLLSSAEEVVGGATAPATPCTPSEVLIPCQICSEEITCSSNDLKMFEKHMEVKHAQNTCPVCSMIFDSRVAGFQQYYEMHVQNHFSADFPKN